MQQPDNANQSRWKYARPRLDLKTVVVLHGDRQRILPAAWIMPVPYGLTTLRLEWNLLLSKSPLTENVVLRSCCSCHSIEEDDSEEDWSESVEGSDSRSSWTAWAASVAFAVAFALGPLGILGCRSRLGLRRKSTRLGLRRKSQA